MELLRLSSLADERLAPYAQLTNHQLRNRLDPTRALLIAETEKVVRLALLQGLEPLSLLVEERWVPQLEERISALLPDDTPVFVLPEDELQKLTGYKLTRGILAAMLRPEPSAVEELLEGARTVAVLEGITDTTNVGAIARSAAALGADALLLSPDCADPLSRRAIRVSMGTIFQLPWARFDKGEWPAAAQSLLHERGFTTVALALDERAVRLDDPALKACDKLALFFGTEGDGLSSKTLSACDYTAIIPMGRGVDSLNVAAASAVAFWELAQR